MPSKQLIQFYMSYAGWLDMGAPHGVVYKRNFGLCFNLNYWCVYHQGDYDSLSREMHQQFVEAGLHQNYPFNHGIADEHTREQFNVNCHENELRINWVRTQSQLGCDLYPELVEEAKQNV